MKSRFTMLACALLLAGGCVTTTPPPIVDVDQPVLRTFGVTVHSTDGGVLTPSGVIVVDTGERLVGVNRDGRLQFDTVLPKWGGFLTVEAEGYQSYIARVALDEMEDITLARPIATPKRLRVSGRSLITADGRPFVWRFVTGFRVVDYVADGDEAAAIAFLDWAQTTGFNGVRVLSMLCQSWFDLCPADGQRALPRTLELAQARGLYLEVVALVGTKTVDLATIAAHVRAIGLICEQSPACAAIELANENAHQSQRDELIDPAYLRTLRALISNIVMVSLGSNCCGQSDEKMLYDGGDYITVHRDRSRSTWDRTRHIREQEVVSSSSKRFVVDDEPIGANEVDQSGRRSANPNEFFGVGVLSRIFNIGATFHCEACLNATVPGPVQTQAAEAFVAGTHVIPDDVALTFQNAGWATSPVKNANFDSFGAPNSTVRAYSGVGGRSILALVGVTGDPGIVLRDPWRLGNVLVDRPGFRVVELGGLRSLRSPRSRR